MTVVVAVDVAAVGAVVVAAVLSNDCWCCCDPCCDKRAIPCTNTEQCPAEEKTKIYGPLPMRKCCKSLAKVVLHTDLPYADYDTFHLKVHKPPVG